MPAPPAFFQRAAGVGIDDMVKMTRLEHEDMLKNLEQRFHSEIVYTHIGDIVISVNPFKNTGNSHPEVQEAYVKAGKRRETFMLPPHVYTMVGDAYDQLMGPMAGPGAKRSRSVLISGESGAGKTEAMKLCVSHLGAVSASDNGGKDSVAVRLMKTNPVMEPIGNAKTVRNNNSSRFGRYVLVRFNDACEVVGAQVRVFLLERSRVTSTSKAKERAYHVMYQLCKGGTPHTSGQAPDYFHYMSMSGQVDCPGQNDAEEFKVTSNALLSVGLSADELDQIWAFLAGMLYIGNVTFGDGDTAVISATGDGDPIRMAEKLMGVGDMTQLLIQQEMIIGGEVTYKALSVTQANQGRDALVKIMYARLFDYLVVRINQTVDDVAKAKLYIGLLDVYGFEFFEVNSFEQVRTTCTCPRAHAHVHRWKQVETGGAWTWAV